VLDPVVVELLFFCALISLVDLSPYTASALFDVLLGCSFYGGLPFSFFTLVVSN